MLATSGASRRPTQLFPVPDLPALLTFVGSARAARAGGTLLRPGALIWLCCSLAGAGPAGSRGRPWALICLLGWTSLGAAPAASAGIDLYPREPLRVHKIQPVDCRLVRGFTHAPVDGRVDTRYPTGTVGEWQGLHGTPAVNYRLFNGNDGLHVTLAEAGFDAIQIRGLWRGGVYAGREGLHPPDGPPLCEVRPRDGAFHRRFEPRVESRRLSFFQEPGQDGALRDLTVLRVDPGEIGLPAADLGDLAGAAGLELAPGTPAELSAPWTDPALAMAALTLELEILQADPGLVLSVRVGDVLDARRDAIRVVFRLHGPGRYAASLDLPDQVFLPRRHEWARPPRMAGPFTPEPRVRVSIESGSPCRLASVKLKAHPVPREEALPEAAAWRKFLLRGLFSAMSEPRPWMHLRHGPPVREQIASSPAIERYRTSLTELLETVEAARLLAPGDSLIAQYHDWIYQNMDRRKPLPSPVLPEEPGAPRWAVLVRENWKEQARIARWWLDHRLVINGEFGGGPQDDTDLFQVWQCLPMIESEPLGARLRAAAAKLADLVVEHRLEEGINKRSMDALHAYEEGVNQLALNAWWNYGDPLHFERILASARSAMRLMVETEDGRVHFGGGRLGIEEARRGFAEIGASPGAFGWAPARLFLHPMHVVADYNGHPAVLERYAAWGRTWLDYQKPGAFVEKVDIPTGEPIRVTDLPSSANIAPLIELLGLYVLTGDPEWHRAYRMGVDGGGFTGVQARYGRTPHALVPWEEPYTSHLREKLSGLQSGYAGFFVNQDQVLLERWLSDSLTWYRRYRYMTTAAEQKTDRILTYRATTAISCYLGDAPNRNRWLNLTAVSYEGLKGEDFAGLVWEAGPRSLRVALYNFREEEVRGRMRVWRLEPGRYRVEAGPDLDDDGRFEEAASQATRTLQRYSAIPLALPPRQVTVVRVEQLQALGGLRRRPDLALSRGDSGSVRVHNIGSVEAEEIRVELRRGDRVVGSRIIDRIEAPLDLHPRRVTVSFEGVRAGDVIVVDPDDRIPEITEHNNRLVLAR